MILYQQMAQAADETDSFVPRNKVTALTAGPLTPEPPLGRFSGLGGKRNVNRCSKTSMSNIHLSLPSHATLSTSIQPFIHLHAAFLLFMRH